MERRNGDTLGTDTRPAEAAHILWECGPRVAGPSDISSKAAVLRELLWFLYLMVV